MEIGPYWIGDQPVTALVIDPTSVDDLTVFDTAEVLFRAPSGQVVTFPGVTFEDGLVTAPWPDGFEFDEAGLWTLEVRLGGLNGTQSLNPITAVVQDSSTGWHTLDSARAEWQANLSDAQLWTLLEVARVQLEAKAPRVETVPINYRQAQLLQARNILNAGRANPITGDLGPESFAGSAYPMTYQVLGLIRPPKGRPLVG